jgi:glucose/mannose-6-phosphate isomerase
MKMHDLVAAFPQQLQKALAIAQQANLNINSDGIQHVLISGLGGSGIGGSIVKELLEPTCSSPILINKDYFLPGWCNHNSLVIICSYSGNTEETVAVMEAALKKGCRVVAVTSGGQVEALAKAHSLPHVIIPGGMPPRSCIGYSLVQLLGIFQASGLTNSDWQQELVDAQALLVQQQDAIQKEAQALADFLFGRMPVIYSLGSTEAISVRFRQQVNENSKVLGWHHVLPEMNHNELVGWAQKNDNLAVVVWRYAHDYERTLHRLSISKEVFAQYTPHYREVEAKGASVLAQALYAVHLGDWCSCFLADLRGVDAMDISIINHLKDSLSKV